MVVRGASVDEHERLPATERAVEDPRFGQPHAALRHRLPGMVEEQLNVLTRFRGDRAPIRRILSKDFDILVYDTGGGLVERILQCHTKGLVTQNLAGRYGYRHGLLNRPRDVSADRGPAIQIRGPETLGQEPPLRLPFGKLAGSSSRGRCRRGRARIRR